MPMTTSDDMKTLAIIPARMDSDRLPGKPLKVVGGRELLVWTYERAKRCQRVDHVLVSTPDEEVASFCKKRRMLWWPTSPLSPSGTHRCAETLEKLKDNAGVDVVVNWQVDEPCVEPYDVDCMIQHLRCSTFGVATLVAPVDDKHQPHDENVVKVAVSASGRCLWFSRAPMRGASLHCGVYAFKADTLRRIRRMPPTLLSRAESLEQLTWLEWSVDMLASYVSKLPLAINLPEDCEKFRKLSTELLRGNDREKD